MDLSRELGMSLRRALQEIDAREFRLWMAYSRIEPMGQFRDDVRAGNICATIANVNRTRGSRRMKISDFIPKFGPPDKRNPRELEAAMDGFMAAHNAFAKQKKR